MKDKDFYQGVIWSTARIMEMHGDEVTAKDVLNEANIPRWAYMLADQYDLDFINGVIDNLPCGNWPEELAMIYLSCGSEWRFGDEIVFFDDELDRVDIFCGGGYNREQFIAFKQEAEK